MTIYRACYATREQVMRAVDIGFTAYNRAQLDTAISTASEFIDGFCHRRFYNVITTASWDWPNYQRAYPWRLWFNQAELADVTTNVPVVTSGGVVIPNADIFWGHPNHSPPYRYLELNVGTSVAFSVASTWQRSITIAGTFGYWTQTIPAGSLAASMLIGDTTATVSNGAAIGVGDVLNVDSESMLVTERSMITTGVTVASGLTTANASDNIVGVASGSAFNLDETLLVDSERLLVTDINGNNLTVKRAWDGTVLAAHTSPTIFASRLLNVNRAFGGTTAAAHSNNATLAIAAVPGLVKALAVAEAVNTVLQQTSGYSRSVGEQGAVMPGTGGGLDDLRDQTYIAYGRQIRVGTI